jgi:hypothetical protein
MTEKAFRLDFFIAVAALGVSVLSTLTLIYQTHVIGQQYASTIWPYLSIVATYELHGASFEVSNEGLGPALIDSAQLEVDGKPVAGWTGYVSALAKEPSIRTAILSARKAALAGHMPAEPRMRFSSIGPGSTIRPGDSSELIKMDFPDYVPLQAILAHRMTIDFCYCSLNGNCWTMHSDQNTKSASHPVAVAACTTSYSIEPPTVTGVKV